MSPGECFSYLQCLLYIYTAQKKYFNRIKTIEKKKKTKNYDSVRYNLLLCYWSVYFSWWNSKHVLRIIKYSRQENAFLLSPALIRLLFQCCQINVSAPLLFKKYFFVTFRLLCFPTSYSDGLFIYSFLLP